MATRALSRMAILMLSKDKIFADIRLPLMLALVLVGDSGHLRQDPNFFRNSFVICESSVGYDGWC
jgi:hypothetical protein